MPLAQAGAGHGCTTAWCAVRRWEASLLPDCPARDDVICVATELAANAVLHTASGRGGHFDVGIWRLDSAVRVTVSDRGSPQGPRRAGCLMAEAGRGLIIVQAGRPSEDPPGDLPVGIRALQLGQGPGWDARWRLAGGR
jgi:hypothetical protein